MRFAVAEPLPLLEAPQVPRANKPRAAKPHEPKDGKRARARDTGEVKPLNVEVSGAHYDVLELLIGRTRHKKRTLVEMPLELLFEQHGLPSPQPPE